MADESIHTTALTQDKLLKTTTVDKDTSIKSFIQSQARYLSGYAVEGRKVVVEWGEESGVEADAKQTTESKTEKDKPSKGFPSPILKPRVPAKNGSQREQTHKRSNKENAEDKKTSRKPSMPQKPKSVKKMDNPTSLKQKPVCSSDDGHAKRLAERKERRRIKKSIVAPKEVRESDEESNEGHFRKPNKRKADPSKDVDRDESDRNGKTKKKLPAGLALMHGFHATNVGKQRLTVNHDISNTGVFSKGKASKKSKVDDRKTKSTKPIFDEAKFLGVSISALTRSGTKRKKEKPPVPSVLDDSSIISIHSDAPSPPKKKHLISNKTPAKKKQEKALPEEVEKSSFLSSAVKSNYESEVWDIELDVEESTVSHEKSTKAPSASIVVKCKDLSWGAKLDQDTIIDTRSVIGQGEKSPTLLSARHSSLAPSQSASQLPIRVAGMDSGMISRFFGHDLKGNPDSGQPKQHKDIQASAPEAARHRSPSPSKHVIVPSDGESPQETTMHHTAPAPFSINSPLLEVDAELGVQTPSDDDLNALHRDPLELLEDLNNGRLLGCSAPWSGDPDVELSEHDLQEGHNTMEHASNYDIFPSVHDVPDDSLGFVHGDPPTQYFGESCPSGGDFFGSFDSQVYGNGDSTIAEDYYVSENDPRTFDAFDFLDASRGLPTDTWFGVQASDVVEDGLMDTLRHDDGHEMDDRYLDDEYAEDDNEIETIEEFADSVFPDESNTSNVSEPFFSQGRALLLGMEFRSKEGESARDNYESALGNLSDVEKSVAKSLRGHWHPMKF